MSISLDERDWQSSKNWDRKVLRNKTQGRERDSCHMLKATGSSTLNKCRWKDSNANLCLLDNASKVLERRLMGGECKQAAIATPSATLFNANISIPSSMARCTSARRSLAD